MTRPQFSLRALLLAMLVAGAFFGGVRFGRQRQLREDEAEIENSQEAGALFFREMERAQPEIEAQKVDVIRLSNLLEKATRKKNEGPTTD